MQISAITSALTPQESKENLSNKSKPAQIVGVSQQFEGILLRQFLQESMKPLLQDGPSGQVYGYLVTDSLADSMSKAGGLGFASVIQAQLGRISQ